MNNLFLASFASVMTTVGYVLVAILVLLVMITVHELGHYIAGKIFKFKIEEFAIGFGPKIFKKQKKNGEIFSIRLIPLGGFCSFGGEDKESDGPNDFNNKKPWQRIIVLVAGAFMNYLLSVIIICATFGAYGRNAILVNDIVEDPTYSTVSLVDDDVILSINGKKTYLLTDLMGTLEGKEKGELVTISVLRDKKVQSVRVALREDAIFKNLEDVEGLSNVLGTAKIEGKQKGIRPQTEYLGNHIGRKHRCLPRYRIHSHILLQRCFPRKSDSRQGINYNVDPEHLNHANGRLVSDKRPDHADPHGTEIHGQLKYDEFPDRAENRSAEMHSLNDSGNIIIGDHQIPRLLRHVGSRAHCKAHVCLL